MSKVNFQVLIYPLLVEVQTCWHMLGHSEATAPYVIENGWETRTYLALDKPSRYTHTGTGVLWHPRSQTRPESYRRYLICYNIRRRGTKRGTIRANGSRQDIGNATNVDRTFKANAGWE